jgi:NAD(P)-dependent dehydrogenase (short-subunit alcohol dehydrogenase family)
MTKEVSKMTRETKVVLITGASSGIGKATALQLLEEGHIVYGAARRVGEMSDIDHHENGYAVKVDITRNEDIASCVEKIIEEQGRIDILFNNAGIAQYGALEDVPIEKARYQFEVNLFGLAEMTKAVLPHMRKERKGQIINTSSAGGVIWSPLGTWYHATKHALEGWSDALRLELTPFGIDVTVIRPGLIKTSIAESARELAPENIENSAYVSMYQKLRAARRASKLKPSPPEVIAKTVSKAIRARKPKTRYTAGSNAKLMIRMRKLLGDRGFDRFILRRLKPKSGEST